MELDKQTMDLLGSGSWGEIIEAHGERFSKAETPNNGEEKATMMFGEGVVVPYPHKA